MDEQGITDESTQPTPALTRPRRMGRPRGRYPAPAGRNGAAPTQPRAARRGQPVLSVYGLPSTRTAYTARGLLVAPQEDPIADAYCWPVGTDRFKQAVRGEALGLLRWWREGRVDSLDELRDLCAVSEDQERALRAAAVGSEFDRIGLERVLLLRQAVWAEIQRLSSQQDKEVS